MKVGQSLVEAGHLSAEHLAEGLAHANGDLLAFQDVVMSRWRVGRNDVALAVSVTLTSTLFALQ
jgi:hypothetical protein